MDLSSVGLLLLALFAAVINGAIGYGFSSIITPVAIFWFPNRILNPALVLVEVGVSAALLVRERRHLRATFPRALPVVSTLLPGVVLGTVGLAYLAVNDVRLVVYAILLPLVGLQLWGFRRPLRDERRGGRALGPMVGFLYALTTISGPPLAMFLRNQGLSKEEFRCTIGQVRLAESVLTLGTYLAFDQLFSSGLVALPSLGLLPLLLVPVLVGVPLGAVFLSRVSPELFRRFVLAVDGVFVSYGLAHVLALEGWVAQDADLLLLVALLTTVAVLVGVSAARAPSPSRSAWGLPPEARPRVIEEPAD